MRGQPARKRQYRVERPPSGPGGELVQPDSGFTVSAEQQHSIAHRDVLNLREVQGQVLERHGQDRCSPAAYQRLRPAARHGPGHTLRRTFGANYLG